LSNVDPTGLWYNPITGRADDAETEKESLEEGGAAAGGGQATGETLTEKGKQEVKVYNTGKIAANAVLYAPKAPDGSIDLRALQKINPSGFAALRNSTFGTLNGTASGSDADFYQRLKAIELALGIPSSAAMASFNASFLAALADSTQETFEVMGEQRKVASEIIAGTALSAVPLGAAFRVVAFFKAAKVAEEGSDVVRTALQALNRSGLRPGQTEISRSRIMELVRNFDSGKATSSVFKSADGRFLVEGHHTTVAGTILGRSGANMGLRTMQAPSATNVFWTKNWWEIGKTAIKVVP
jgi:hypothetical protein